MEEELETLIPLVFYKVFEGKETAINLTVHGEHNIDATGKHIAAHKAIDSDGKIVWQADMH